MVIKEGKLGNKLQKWKMSDYIMLAVLDSERFC